MIFPVIRQTIVRSIHACSVAYTGNKDLMIFPVIRQTIVRSIHACSVAYTGNKD